MTRKQLLTLVLLGSITLVLVASVTPVMSAGGLLADFEDGLPAGWFVFNGGSTVATTTQVIDDGSALARPGQAGDNEILAGDFNVFDYGGFGQAYDSPAAPQDWSGYVSFDFWFYGTGSGLTYQAEISDNRSDPSMDTSERFDYAFTDSTP